MKTEFLYRLKFHYTKSVEPASAEGELGKEDQHFFILEGTVTGKINGTIFGLNHPVRRPDDVFMSDAQASISTDDGATIFVDLKGMGVHVKGKKYRSYVGPLRHLSSHPNYNWLNKTWTIGSGVVGATALAIGDKETVCDVYTILYEDGVDGTKNL